jgi:hypothetical protein
MTAGMERSLKMLATRFLLAAAMALAVSGVARAQELDACSKSTLSGLYVFTASGFNIVSGVPQPKAIVELIRFNGDGTLNNPWTTVSINGAITQHPHPPDLAGTGSYSVGADCTGTLHFDTGPNYDFFVGFNSTEIQMIQTNSNTVFQGKAERVSR